MILTGSKVDLNNPSFETVRVTRNEYGKQVDRYLYFDDASNWKYHYFTPVNTVVKNSYHARARVLCRHKEGHIWIILGNWRKRNQKPEVFLEGLPTWYDEVITYGEDWLLGK